MNNDTAPIRDIMHYESDIWSIADMLLSAGIKHVWHLGDDKV